MDIITHYTLLFKFLFQYDDLQWDGAFYIQPLSKVLFIEITPLRDLSVINTVRNTDSAAHPLINDKQETKLNTDNSSLKKPKYSAAHQCLLDNPRYLLAAL